MMFEYIHKSGNNLKLIESKEELQGDSYYLVKHVPVEFDERFQYLHIKPYSYWDFNEELKEVVPTYYVMSIPLDTLKKRAKEEITEHRWNVLTGGVTLPNGIKVATTNDDQNRISSIVSNSHLVGLAKSSEIDFKSETGWVKLTIEELEQIVGFIGIHIQKCYSTEKALHDLVDNLTNAGDVLSFDVSTNWDLLYEA